MPSKQVQKDRLRCVIAGKVVDAPQPGVALREWREKFEVRQCALAEEMGVGSSVVSDYERGRRHDPGVGFVSNYISSLLDIDAERGGEILHYYHSKYPLMERETALEPPTA